MESSIEHFMEQHMEHFSENSVNNHVDQSTEHSAQTGGPRCEVTMNNQGGDKLHFNGYSYSKKAISANAIRWTCATPTRSVIRCKGAITTDRERPYCNPRSLVLHNHPPEDPEASIMRDIARANRRLFRRKVYQHPFQFYPWMYPLQQQQQDQDRNDPLVFPSAALEAALSMGGRKLVRDDFVYRIKNKVDGRQYYSCDRGCTATVVVLNDMVQSARGVHRHPPEKDKIARLFPCPVETSVKQEQPSPPPPPPLPQQLQPEEEMEIDRGSSARADLGPGPSGYQDDQVQVKIEPEWVDAGALEPNCELEGQFDDPQDLNAGYQDEDVDGQRNEPDFPPMYSRHSQLQQPTMVPDARDPVKLHVPGKPNLTITVASPRPTPSAPTPSSAPTSAPTSLPGVYLLNRKRGRPRGSAYGTYNENEDRVTTILAENIIANQKQRAVASGPAPVYRSPVTAAMSSPVPGRVKPRCKDPEAVRAAQIVNNAQNKMSSREELEKACLKLRQEVLALEVQNLKAEREKLAAYRRNIAVRREIMKLHLQLESGIPSECASSGRGFNTVGIFSASSDRMNDSQKDYGASLTEDRNVSKKTGDSTEDSVSVMSSNSEAKISVRKSLQVTTQNQITSEPQIMSVGDSLAISSKPCLSEVAYADGDRPISEDASDPSEQWGGSQTSEEQCNKNENLQWVDEREGNVFPLSDNNDTSEALVQGKDTSQSQGQDSGDDLSILDSVSPDIRPDLSIEYISDPGSRQWTQSSNYVEPDRYNQQFDSNFDNSYTRSTMVQNSAEKEPPDNGFEADNDVNKTSKRRRVENMWEPENNS